MSDSNTTDFTNPYTFILLGIPGLEAANVCIFCTMYAIAIFENFTILFIVKMDSSLHGPMYYFLCMLAVTDLVLSMSILLKTLMMESGIFMTIALDCYVGICDPLSHSATLTNPTVAKIVPDIVLHGGILVLPYTFLARWWTYCRTNIIPHSYCEHRAVVKLACIDTHISSYYGLSVAIWVTGLDVIFIAMSYIQILRAIFSLSTKGARLKNFGTCGSQLCTILTFYILVIFSSLTGVGVEEVDPPQKREHKEVFEYDAGLWDMSALTRF
nr:olfactory receptor 52R1-like [Chrysemys picta bellii]